MRLCIWLFPEALFGVECGARDQAVSLLYAAVQGLRDEFIDKGNLVCPARRRRKSGYGKVITVSDREILHVQSHRKNQGILIDRADHIFLEWLTAVPYADRYRVDMIIHAQVHLRNRSLHPVYKGRCQVGNFFNRSWSSMERYSCTPLDGHLHWQPARTIE